jgi:rhamnogalacturonan endolyase
MNDLDAATCSGMGSVNCLTGAAVSSSAGSNFLIYWDADEARELLNDISISKPGGGTLLTATGCSSCNGTKATPTLTADLLGDWREEVVYRESSNTALRVYTTTTVTKRRIYTLMHDPTYRAQVAFENASYNQPPHTGFHIGAGMDNPPVPNIYLAK